MRIVVIAGGTSGEREVSLRSGAAIAAALEIAGHQATIVDRPLGPELATAYDVAFPIIHGAGGEDGSLQQELETIGLPYVGSGVAACQLTFDKAGYKQILDQAGIPTPRGASVDSKSLHNHPLAQAAFVLKPNDGGSSVDTFIVRDIANAAWDDMQRALEKYGEMLLEELIEGVEITIGVLGEQALPVIEIVPPAGGEFDYQNKYNGATQELCPPQHVDAVVQQQAQKLAEQIHQLCGCKDFSRTDMIVATDGRLVVLETNTLPGMTDQSLFPKAAGVSGLSMSELCDALVQLVIASKTDDV